MRQKAGPRERSNRENNDHSIIIVIVFVVVIIFMPSCLLLHCEHRYAIYPSVSRVTGTGEILGNFY